MKDVLDWQEFYESLQGYELACASFNIFLEQQHDQC